MDARQRELAETGYVVLSNHMSPEMLARMRDRVEELFAEEGESAGAEFRREENARRLANLIDKGDVFREPVLHAPVLELVGSVLGPGFKLSSLNVRSANPNSASLQPLHVDMGLLPDEKGFA